MQSIRNRGFKKKKMIIIRVWGGLGNQMFQYALYRVYSLKGMETKLDISSCEERPIHNGYELQNIFRVSDCLYASKRECSRFAFYKVNKLNRLLIRIIPRKTCYTVIKEKEYGYDERALELSNCYIEGYFQSEKYFSDIETVIRNDFTFKKEKTDNVIKWETGIEKVGRNSVSLHVRRGNYVSQKTKERLLCDTLYYEKAIEFISSKITNPVFFVFSDDIEWCKKRFSDLNCCYVTGNEGEQAAWDMYLMSRCSHNIIANSSFSWWGAWLNANAAKMVIAPKEWSSKKKFTDTVPDEWIKL